VQQWVKEATIALPSQLRTVPIKFYSFIDKLLCLINTVTAILELLTVLLEYLIAHVQQGKGHAPVPPLWIHH